MARLPAQSVALAAPVGGWNARDGLPDMEPNDAVTLTNIFPGTTVCQVRNGYSQYSTDLTDQVETVMAYNGASANQLFGIAGGTIYDATITGAAAPTTATGLTNSRWQWVNIPTPAGHYLSLVNGSDDALSYDGSAWSNPTFTGVDSSDLINVNLFKNRQWFIEKDTLKAWYLPIQSIAGALVALDMSSYCQEGGFLVDMGTLTMDAGYGVDDYAVWITNKGEVLWWQLTDPTTPTGIALIGVFRIGSPVGRRCFVKWAGDLLVITQDGLVPLIGALKSSRLDPRVSLTDKIQAAVSSAVTLYGNNFGWQILPFPKQNMLFLNVPLQEGAMQQQYTMNTINKSWCNFTGWNANCWCLYNDEPYFGSNGFIGKAWDGLTDNGININWEALQAFNYFGSPGLIKRFTSMKPVFLTSGSPQIYANVNVDFDLSNTSAPLSFSPTTYAEWDSALWDEGLWGGDLTVSQQWEGITGIGNCAAIHLYGSSAGIEVQWAGTTVTFEKGGIL